MESATDIKKKKKKKVANCSHLELKNLTKFCKSTHLGALEPITYVHVEWPSQFKLCSNSLFLNEGKHIFVVSWRI